MSPCCARASPWRCRVRPAALRWKGSCTTKRKRSSAPASRVRAQRDGYRTGSRVRPYSLGRHLVPARGNTHTGNVRRWEGFRATSIDQYRLRRCACGGGPIDGARRGERRWVQAHTLGIRQTWRRIAPGSEPRERVGSRCGAEHTVVGGQQRHQHVDALRRDRDAVAARGEGGRRPDRDGLQRRRRFRW